MKKKLLLLLLFLPIIMMAQKPPNAVTLENEFLKIAFDKEQKTYTFFERQAGEWIPILQDATMSLTLHGADSLFLNTAEGEVTSRREKVNDAIGGGMRMIVNAQGKEAAWQIEFTLYHGRREGTIVASVKNGSAAPWKMNNFRLLDMRGQPSMFFASGNILMHVNGYQSWSNCEVAAVEPSSKLVSYWSTVWTEPDAHRTALFGFLNNNRAINTIVAGQFDKANRALSVTVNSELRTVVLLPEKEWRSDKFYFAYGPLPDPLLTGYAQLTQTLADSVEKPFTPNGKTTLGRRGGVPTGWCSWYYYYQNIFEDSILANLDAAAKNLKEAGMQYFQIDDGYQVAAGDWGMNSKFPHGHKWLVDQIHKRGLKAGLWVAPFAVAERSALFAEHPDWLLRTEQDSLQEFSSNVWWGGKIYGLDPTVPAARNWLTWLFEQIVTKWGYDYVKIDFLYYAAEGVKYRQPVSPVEAYRMGLQAIRRGVGAEKIILGCGAPIGPSVGYVDAMRIGPDVFAGWGGITPGVNAAAERSFYHDAVWFNDPDCLLVRSPLNIDQARVWASVIALSGQMPVSSDNLAALPQERLDLVAMTMPSYGKPAEEVDLFSTPKNRGLTIIGSDGQEVRLPAIWKFAPGDNIDYKEPSFNDSAWAPMPVPSHWEDHGYPNLDGYAWYRVKFTLPADWKPGRAAFSFGKVDDCDETYLNGSLIGKDGDMPPKYESDWPTFRVYPVREDVLKPGAENTLAVRVYDGNGPGGIYSTKEFSLPSVWNLPVVTTFGNWNVAGVFNWSGTDATYKLSMQDLGLSAKKSYLVYELWSDRFVGEIKDTLNLSLAPGSCNILSIHENRRVPKIIATSRHIVQGAIDIADERWIPDSKLLTVKSKKLLHGSYRVTLYVPDDLKIKDITGGVVHTEKQIDPTVWQITFDKLAGGELNWSVQFE